MTVSSLLGVEEAMFKFIYVGRNRTGGQILEIAQGDKLKGVAVNNMIKADKLLTDLEKTLEVGGNTAIYYKLNRNSNGTASEVCTAVMERHGLQKSFLKVKELLTLENKVRRNKDIDTLKLRNTPLVALASLHYLLVSKDPKNTYNVEVFLAKVMSYNTLEKYYTRFREDELDAVYSGTSKCNKLAVSFLYIKNLQQKVTTSSSKNLTVTKLAGVGITI